MVGGLRARLRVIAHFFVLGAVVLAGREAFATLSKPAPAPLVVAVVHDANEAAVERAIDEAVLLNEAVMQELHRTDAVVRDRLVRNMRFAAADSGESDDVLFERALALGMHLSDSVARARLLDAASRWLLAKRPHREPSQAELQAYLHAHRERFEDAEQWTFHQAFVSRQRHGAQAFNVARELLDTLRRDDVRPDEAGPRADPTLLPTVMRAPARRIDGRFGAGFSDAIAKLPPKSWQGPVKSSFGMHAVWVSAHESARLPPLSEVEGAVRRHFAHDARERQLRKLLRQLRGGYVVELRRAP